MQRSRSVPLPRADRTDLCDHSPQMMASLESVFSSIHRVFEGSAAAGATSSTSLQDHAAAAAAFPRVQEVLLLFGPSARSPLLTYVSLQQRAAVTSCAARADITLRRLLCSCVYTAVTHSLCSTLRHESARCRGDASSHQSAGDAPIDRLWREAVSEQESRRTQRFAPLLAVGTQEQQGRFSGSPVRA